MHGVHPERVNMKIPEPHENIFYDIVTNAIAPRVVIIHCLSPWGFVFVGKIWTELAKIISFRPEVIVDDVEHYSDPLSMAGLN
jgi:hypothetical protein